MLQLVRENRRSDWEWPEPPVDYDDPDPRAGFERDFPANYRRRHRRPVAGRIGLTLLIAVALMSVGAGTYVAARSGTFDAVLARLQALASPSQSELAQQRSAGAAQPAALSPIPDVQGLVILIRNAVVALHQANTTGNYAVLRQIAAPGFQQATTPASISQAFSDLRRRGVDLARITVVNPSLRRDPVIDDQGLLRLAGFFPAASGQVDFDLAFQMVGGRWQLFGIGAYPPAPPAGEEAAPKPPALKAAVEATIPDPATMVGLIRGTVIALNQANRVDDYSVLWAISAPRFQEANSPAQLSAIFAELRARQLDLGPVAVIDPELFRPPTIDQRGYLRLVGYFPSRPEQVNFDLAFQFDAGQWRLFGIGLNTSREVPVASAAPPPGGGAGSQANNQPVAGVPNLAVGEPPAPRLRPAALGSR